MSGEGGVRVALVPGCQGSLLPMTRVMMFNSAVAVFVAESMTTVPCHDSDKRDAIRKDRVSLFPLRSVTLSGMPTTAP